MQSLGLDFGTTNTVVAKAGPDGATRAVAFRMPVEAFETIRSVLCFQQEEETGRGKVELDVGPMAIERYQQDQGSCRFLQSIKSFAASPHFDGTKIFGRSYGFDDLLHAFLQRLFAQGSEDVQPLPKRLVVGRPVKFVGFQADPDLAMKRYVSALGRLGIEEMLFVHEPVAAAFHFARQLTQPANVLVADAGGGTTDYSLMRFEMRDGQPHAEPLGGGGVGIAGDQFDYRIVENVILPRIGRDSLFESMGKTLEMPRANFSAFERWNDLSLFRGTAEFREIKKLLRYSLEPEKLQRLIDIVENELGYALYQSVSKVKEALSHAEEVTFSFPPLGRDFAARVTRAEFERWIAADLAKMETALDESLADAGLGAGDVDRVFLTGGTSFVPALRGLYERRFGAERVESGDRLLSIGHGLALIGRRDDAERWATHTFRQT